MLKKGKISMALRNRKTLTDFNEILRAYYLAPKATFPHYCVSIFQIFIFSAQPNSHTVHIGELWDKIPFIILSPVKRLCESPVQTFSLISCFTYYKSVRLGPRIVGLVLRQTYS